MPTIAASVPELPQTLIGDVGVPAHVSAGRRNGMLAAVEAVNALDAFAERARPIGA